ncbi:Zn-ribbon domain-containing OB-fold protein [Streptomyces sp. NPDC048282]|uniref:Zn-ribbon domain-containing OB-fold protein n=1 Tax=Streptomyces sp. NPDC048282 TaxID=3365528 RepID=UPI00371F96AA
MSPIVNVEVQPPRLRGGRCQVCELVFMPAQGYGCERCGATGGDLLAVDIDSRGTVTAATVVYHDPDPQRTVPFRIIEVEVEHGLRVRGLAAAGEDLERGDRVVLARVPDAPVDDELAGVAFVRAGDAP